VNLDDLAGRATITVEEAGVLLGLSRNSAYLAAKRDELPTLRIGRRVLVPCRA
jgi:excisionase family DNA binding protein